MSEPNPKDDGGPAFPMALPKDWADFNHGMSLRDWFAGQALAGMNASCHDLLEWPSGTYLARMVENAYAQADAMLAARKGCAQ